MKKVPKQTSAKGPADWFTGDVWIDAIARGEEPSRVRVNAVRFNPSARTAWHSHTLGQTLFVTDGVGLAQARGERLVSRERLIPKRGKPQIRLPIPVFFIELENACPLDTFDQDFGIAVRQFQGLDDV